MADIPRSPRDQPLAVGDNAAHCPAGQAMELVAHKWTIHIVFALHEAGVPARFRELQRRVAPITQKELTKRLRDLERSGLVGRRGDAGGAPRGGDWVAGGGPNLLPAPPSPPQKAPSLWAPGGG